jgi:valyl-tRNA synthetase
MWPDCLLPISDPDIEDHFVFFQQILAGMREIRATKKIHFRHQLRFTVACNQRRREFLDRTLPFFQSLTNAQLMDAGAIKIGAYFHFEDAAIAVELPDLDAQLQAQRKKDREKNLSTLARAIASKRAQLANENFTSRAPADVVAKVRDTLRTLEQKQQEILKEFAA